MKSAAEKLKVMGNAQYLKKNYFDAAELYEKAISYDATNPVYRFNAAKTYKEMGRWREAEASSAKALELDRKYIKAWILNGKCLIEFGKYAVDTAKIDQGISNIREGIALCSGQQKREFEAEATRSLRNGLKVRWHKQHEILVQEANKMAAYFEDLIMQKEDVTEDQRLASIRSMRQFLIPRRKKRKSDIPEYLLCDYSGELMEDPVTTSEGYTYERETLAKFMRENGKTDPTTRRGIDPAKIYPNLSIRAATEQFLDKHPWAYSYKGDEEDYRDIHI